MLYSPSLACADQLALASDIRQLMDCGLTTLHFDVMDGHYVPNLCLSLDTAASIRAAFPQAVLDVHLMATSPELYIDRLHDVGADYVTFHQNATSFALRTIASIHSAGMRAGVALNPSQRPEELLPLLPHTDLVLVMSIEPGFPARNSCLTPCGPWRSLTASAPSRVWILLFRWTGASTPTSDAN